MVIFRCGYLSRAVSFQQNEKLVLVEIYNARLLLLHVYDCSRVHSLYLLCMIVLMFIMRLFSFLQATCAF